MLQRGPLKRGSLPSSSKRRSSSSLESSEVFDVDEAPPELEGTLVLQASECSGHSLPIGPDHGAKVLMSVACGYANLPGSLHPLALDEEEDQASEPCWHLFLESRPACASRSSEGALRGD